MNAINRFVDLSMRRQSGPKEVVAAARECFQELQLAKADDCRAVSETLHSASLLMLRARTDGEVDGLRALVGEGVRSFLSKAKERQARPFPIDKELNSALELSRWSTGAARALNALSRANQLASAPLLLAQPGDLQRLMMICLDSCALAIKHCEEVQRREKIDASKAADEDGSDFVDLFRERSRAIRTQCFSDLTLSLTALETLLSRASTEQLFALKPGSREETAASSSLTLQDMLTEVTTVGLIPSLPEASVEALAKATSALLGLDRKLDVTSAELEDSERRQAYRDCLAALLSGVAATATARLHAAVTTASSAGNVHNVRPEALVLLLDVFSSSLGSGRTRGRKDLQPPTSEGSSVSVRAPQLFSAAATYLMSPISIAAPSSGASSPSLVVLSSLSGPHLARVARSFSSSRFVEWESPPIVSLWAGIALATAKRLTDDVKRIRAGSVGGDLAFSPGLVSHLLASFTRASVRAPALASLALLHLDAVASSSSVQPATQGGASSMSSLAPSPSFSSTAAPYPLPVDMQSSVNLLWSCALQGVFKPAGVIVRLLSTVAIDSTPSNKSALDQGALAQLYVAAVGLLVEGTPELRTFLLENFPPSVLEAAGNAYSAVLKREEAAKAKDDVRHKQSQQMKIEFAKALQDAVHAVAAARPAVQVARKGRKRRTAEKAEGPNPHSVSATPTTRTAGWRLLGDGEKPCEVPVVATADSSKAGAQQLSSSFCLTADFLLVPDGDNNRNKDFKGVAVLVLNPSHFVRSRLLPTGPAAGPISNSSPAAEGSARQKAPGPLALASTALPGGLAFPVATPSALSVAAAVGPSSVGHPTSTSVSLGLRKALLLDASDVREKEGAGQGSLALLDSFSSAVPALNLSTASQARWLERLGYRVLTVAPYLEWPMAHGASPHAEAMLQGERTRWLLEDKGLGALLREADDEWPDEDADV